MNLFNPPKYAKGSLVGVNGNAFSVMAYFNDQATSCNWSKDDIEKVIEQAKSGDYDNLVATINSHLTSDSKKVFSSDSTYNESDYLEKLESIKSKYSSNPQSREYILLAALIEAIENNSEFTNEDDDANGLMNYLMFYTNRQIKNLIKMHSEPKELSVGIDSMYEFYACFTPLITDYFLEQFVVLKSDDNFSLAEYRENLHSENESRDHEEENIFFYKHHDSDDNNYGGDSNDSCSSGSNGGDSCDGGSD